MRAIPSGLEAKNALGTTTAAVCWKVTRLHDDAVFGFTEHPHSLTVSGVVYQPFSGFTASQVKSTLGLSVDNMEISGAFSSEAITEADLLAGYWDHALVEQFEVDYTDTSLGVHKIGSGRIGEVRSGKLAFEAEFLGIGQALQQNIGRLALGPCIADFGDARCGLDLNVIPDGKFTAVPITSVTNARVFAATSLTQAAGWFTGGLVTFTTGPNLGLSMEVKTHGASGALTLQLPMPYAMTAGDEFTITKGCDKTKDACKANNNIVRHRGLPFLPGTDRMVTGT